MNVLLYAVHTHTPAHPPHTACTHAHTHTTHTEIHKTKKNVGQNVGHFVVRAPPPSPHRSPCVTSATTGITRPSTKQAPQAELIVALTSPSVVRAPKIPQQNRTKSLSLSIPSQSQIPYSPFCLDLGTGCQVEKETFSCAVLLA